MSKREFQDIITTLHGRYAFSETSGHRTASRNALVGGHPNSRHLLGLAIDCILDDDIRDEGDFVADAKRLGLNVIVEGDHTHLQAP